MSIKRSFLFLGALALAAAPVLGQAVVHNNDDRDMFIGVGSSTSIRPNIMVLADNSGSMNSAIYHPLYDATIDYTKDSDGKTLLLKVDNSIFTFDNNASYSYNGTDTILFNVCRGNSTSTPAWDARGTFYSLYKSDPSKWIVYKNTIQGTFPVIGQVIDYDGVGSGIDDQATIISLTEKRDYWIITVAGYNGTPNAGARLYINYHLETVQDNTEAEFVPAGQACTGYDQTIANIKLFGTSDVDGNQTRYDRNYLYWLAFKATDAQLAEVAAWTDTGNFPEKGTGPLVYYGHYRIQVERDVLSDVMREVHPQVNLGLACFLGDNHGGYVRENLTNFNTDSALEEMIKNNVTNLLADTNTPLAETLADIWHYMIGQSPGVLQPHTDQNVAQDCPLEVKCQKQYVIIMTDGQATYDELTADTATRFANSYFTSHPVKKSLGGWGDDDDHDPVLGVQPTSLTKTDGTPYCANYSCWGLDGNNGSHGTDYLDDIAYYMAHNDHFPDDVFATHKDFALKYEGDQTIETYVIGFNADNDMLAETAENGNGEYYTAQSYDELKTALTNAIVNILLRNMAFAAFTAPKKITSTVGEGFSFIGYFMPDAVSAIWTGHLQSHRMTDKWFADTDKSGKLEHENSLGEDEYLNTFYDYQPICESTTGLKCFRSIELSATPVWDAQAEVLKSTADRVLFTHDSGNLSAPYDLISFTDAGNIATLKGLFQLPANPDPIPLTQANTIVSTISSKIFGDVFHSDIAYVGAPLPGKKYVKNLNPAACDSTPKDGNANCYENLLKTWGATPGEDESGRLKVVYVGTNDGVMHQIQAKDGKERWGFIPDDVLPNLKKIVLDNQYTYTVDGRLAADDIWYHLLSDTSFTNSAWKTILVFGLKDGGNSFYALDITDITAAQPTVLWKFVDDDYSGKSWSKPFIGKIRYPLGDGWIDRWVVVLAGGMAFNNENSANTAGKSVFVVDASTGELIWMLGYNAGGATDVSSTPQIEASIDGDYTGPGVRYLTAKAEFNYPIPSAITPVDRDSDGYLDTIYFGNVAGHLFKTNIAPANPAQWQTFQLYKEDNSTYTAEDTVSSTLGNTVTLGSTVGFALHQNVFGLTSKAMATVDYVDNKDLTVGYLPGSPAFAANETIVVPTFDPIYLSPAVAFDPCYNLWVAFGTGDRVRSRTNPDSGKFIAIRDGSTVVSSASVQKTDIAAADLVTLTWSGTTMAPTNIKVADKWGWQFAFPMAANHEKLFDPEPLFLPDLKMVPHIYFNTYQPSLESTSEDCDAPKNGLMYFYDMTMNYCGNGTMGGTYESGRIAGGGVFQGSDYIIYQGTGEVASIPPLQDILPVKLIYTGGLLFWKEKKR